MRSSSQPPLPNANTVSHCLALLVCQNEWSVQCALNPSLVHPVRNLGYPGRTSRLICSNGEVLARRRCLSKRGTPEYSLTAPHTPLHCPTCCGWIRGRKDPPTDGTRVQNTLSYLEWYVRNQHHRSVSTVSARLLAAHTCTTRPTRAFNPLACARTCWRRGCTWKKGGAPDIAEELLATTCTTHTHTAEHGRAADTATHCLLGAQPAPAGAVGHVGHVPWH